MKRRKAIQLAVSSTCTLASIWLGAWLTGSVFHYGDWQHFPAFLTSALFALAAGTCTVYALIEWLAE